MIAEILNEQGEVIARIVAGTPEWMDAQYGVGMWRQEVLPEPEPEA